MSEVVCIIVGILILLAVVLPNRDGKCPLCGGEGERKVDGKKVRCIICSGKGVLK